MCIDCDTSATRVWGGFSAGCRGCAARAAARMPQFARVRQAGRLDRDYRRMLEQLRVSHDEVREAAKVDFEMREVAR